MLTINVTTNAQQFTAWLDDIQKQQVPFALARALTQTAKLVQESEYHEIRDVFDRPTPYTLNSIFTKPATKQTLTATVGLKEDSSKGLPPTKYLAAEIKGGGRALKRVERALEVVGALPAGFWIVPGSGAKIDAYGNWDRGEIVRVLSYFKAYPEAGYKSNITDARKKRLERGTKTKIGYAYFVGRPADGKLPFGIWQRFHLGHGSAIKPIALFISGPRYEAIFDFEFVARTTVERDFPRVFGESLRQALASARRA